MTTTVRIILERLTGEAVRVTGRIEGRTAAEASGTESQARDLVRAVLKKTASQHMVGDKYDPEFVSLNDAALAVL